MIANNALCSLIRSTTIVVIIDGYGRRRSIGACCWCPYKTWKGEVLRLECQLVLYQYYAKCKKWYYEWESHP
ncbi:hypothetical protein Fmac_027346 [Flemingia macrophylla]|uniref:Uncharacterized protein n=1 Tax=Flemingia macrophylla TaxID=520843 RepID=A0ABD1LHL0_9FABA